MMRFSEHQSLQWTPRTGSTHNGDGRCSETVFSAPREKFTGCLFRYACSTTSFSPVVPMACRIKLKRLKSRGATMRTRFSRVLALKTMTMVFHNPPFKINFRAEVRFGFSMNCETSQTLKG